MDRTEDGIRSQEKNSANKSRQRMKQVKWRAVPFLTNMTTYNPLHAGASPSRSRSRSTSFHSGNSELEILTSESGLKGLETSTRRFPWSEPCGASSPKRGQLWGPSGRLWWFGLGRCRQPPQWPGRWAWEKGVFLLGYSWGSKHQWEHAMEIKSDSSPNFASGENSKTSFSKVHLKFLEF